MPSRIASFDTLKVPAILGVIWLHVQLFNAPEYNHTPYRLIALIGDWAARFAVPFFFLVSGYLFAKAVQRGNSPWPLLRRYSRRLLSLFVIWSVIYAVLPQNWYTPIADHFHDTLDFIQHHPVSVILHGIRPHLWYLIGLTCSLAFLTSCIVLGHERIALVGAALLYAIHLAINPYAVLGLRMANTTQNTPLTACIFVVLGWTFAKEPIVSSGAAWSLAIGGFLLSSFEIIALHFILHTGLDFHSFVLGTVPFGIGIFALAIQNPRLGEGTILTKLGPLTVGVYVSHMLVLDFINPLRSWWNSPIMELLMPIIAYGACIALILCYQYLLNCLTFFKAILWQR